MPIVFMWALRGMIFVASALSIGLAFARNRDDEKENKIPTGNGPLKNVETFEEVAARVREEIRQNPKFAEGMTEAHKKRIGLTDEDLSKKSDPSS